MAVNHQMKTEADNPTLGLLICKDMDKVEAQYALESTSQPLGISSYELSKLIPEEFRVQNNDVWLTQKAISQLFDVDRSVISKHLNNIYKNGELSENSTCANFAQVADNGKTYNYKYYSLAAIIAVGYRTNSERATQFRAWATKVLESFTKQGYVLDKDRLINDQIFNEDYFVVDSYQALMDIVTR